MNAASVRLAADLIAVDTQNPPGDEQAAAEVVARFLARNGVRRIEIDALEAKRANLVARIGRGSGPTFVMSGHLDTVVADAGGWTRSPHSAVVEGGRLYGLGACDMKGAVAAMAVSMARLTAREGEMSGELLLALTAGEETDGRGAERLVRHDELRAADAILIGEPTSMQVGVAHKGALWLSAVTKGRGGHSSDPNTRDNAILRMIRWLQSTGVVDGIFQEVSGDGWLGPPTVSVNMISGGMNYNVVPESCRVVLDIRTVPGQDHAALATELQDQADGTAIEILRDSRPVSTPPDADFVRLVRDCVREAGNGTAELIGLPYLTDGGVFRRESGAPIVLLGPGDRALAHVADESVEIEMLEHAASAYQSVAERMLGLAGRGAVLDAVGASEMDKDEKG